MASTPDAPFEAALEALRTDIVTCHSLEAGLRGKSGEAGGKGKVARLAKGGDGCDKRSVGEILDKCMVACAESRKRYRAEEFTPVDTSDRALSQMARFTRGIALEPFARFLHYVPRLVNVVCLNVSRTATVFSRTFCIRTICTSPSPCCALSRRTLSIRTGNTASLLPLPRARIRLSQVTLAEALPMEGSGITLPLDLRHIASRCKGSFYAPKRFAVCTERPHWVCTDTKTLVRVFAGSAACVFFTARTRLDFPYASSCLDKLCSTV